MSTLHATAIIEPGAKLGAGVKIGPYCVVGAQVELGDGVELKSHVVVAGRTIIGARTRVFPFASLGHEPQDLKFHGEENRLEIGADCTIREGVTMNPGTEAGGGLTRVGHSGTFLAYSHVAHDCLVGDHVIFSNNVMLAGHCRVGNHVIIGGGAGIHQFVRLGNHAFIGAMSGVTQDVIPYGMAVSDQRDAQLSGLNVVGLKRRGFALSAVHELRRAYRLLFAPEGTLRERVEDVAAAFDTHPLVHEVLAFIREGGDRSILTPREGRGSTASRSEV